MAFAYIVLLAVIMPLTLQSQNLSPRALYERCYAKLVRATPQTDDPFIPQIANGSMTGIQACQALVDLPVFNVNSRIPTDYSPEKNQLAKSVLQSMNELHVSWFSNKQIVNSNNCLNQHTKAVVDSLEPALFFTKALFDIDSDISSAVTGTQGLRALRSVNSPTKSVIDGRILSDNIKEWSPLLVPNGELLGVRAAAAEVPPILRGFATELDATVYQLPPVDIRRSLGGGAIGSQGALMANMGMENDYANDLQHIARDWPKHFYKDYFCRDLPVIEPEDADPFVVCMTSGQANCTITPTAAERPNVLPYRQRQSCTQCHASMDQLAGVVRNYRIYQTSSVRCNMQDKIGSTVAVQPGPVTKTAYNNWPYVKKADYFKTANFGRVYFRGFGNTIDTTIDPALVTNTRRRDLPVNNLNELGTVVAGEYDFYICQAKRYYQFFTGIDVDLSPKSAAQINTLSTDQKFYRGVVIDLGIKLKQHKDSRRLVKEILAKPEYRKKDFRLRELAGGM